MNTITIDKAALEQALEALEALEAKQAMLIKIAKLLCEITGEPILELGDSEAGSALRQALEQPAQQPTNCRHCGGADTVICAGQCKQPAQQEPVAWRYKIVDCFGRPVWTLKTPKTDTRVLESQPLYANPQTIDKSAAVRIATALGWEPKREPLTDEQIEDLYFDGFSISNLKEFARAIEAAHGITGEKK